APTARARGIFAAGRRASMVRCHISATRQLPRHCRLAGQLPTNERGERGGPTWVGEGGFRRRAKTRKYGVFVSNKLFSAILIACSLFAFPALARDAAALPALSTSNAAALTPDQARRALD